ncbi:MAG: 30S ribosomal protein S9 [Spirochaetaceae bacterium]
MEKAIGTGRRKRSVARVYVAPGNGTISINGKDVESYFGFGEHAYMVHQPLAALAGEEKFDVTVTVKGGGKKGQAGAIRHGLARALVAFDETNKPVMRENGFLTRDPRMVERKKYGRPGARRKFQFSKR